MGALIPVITAIPYPFQGRASFAGKWFETEAKIAKRKIEKEKRRKKC